MTKALIVVDVQNDFCEGGSLAVTGGKAVAKTTSDYLENHSDDYDLVIATRDWHEHNNDNGGHFSESPDYVDTWPAHCVQGTYGSEYAEDFELDHVAVHIVKGQGKPSYSGFEGVLQGSRITLEDVLKAASITSLDVVGLAFDYCVAKTALSGVTAGFNVTVLKELTASVNPANDEAVIEALEAAGVTVQA